MTFIGNGMMVSRSLEAAELLAERRHRGGGAGDAHGQAAGHRGDHGRGARPARWSPPRSTASSAGWAARWPRWSATPVPVPVKRVGLPDRFAETGPYHAILDRYGMSVAHVVAAARAAVALKK